MAGNLVAGRTGLALADTPERLDRGHACRQALAPCLRGMGVVQIQMSPRRVCVGGWGLLLRSNLTGNDSCLCDLCTKKACDEKCFCYDCSGFGVPGSPPALLVACRGHR